jgi:ubiquinone/menaquinone biosynthesis C-methylase UbiE
VKRLAERLRGVPPRRGEAGVVVRSDRVGGSTVVDDYWSRHTVNSKPFASAEESSAYLDWRFGQYPLYKEFMTLWGGRDGQTVLDYGCGPGDDTTGYLLYSRAAKVIGIDVSPKALDLTRRRLNLHGIDLDKVDLILSSDASTTVPLDTESVDYFQSSGVLHHTSHPDVLLKELHRVLRRGGDARVMVYNYDSVWLHLYTAYVKMELEGAFSGLTVREAFARNTDGEECPIARCYTPAEFGSLCEEAGFAWEFLGGYPARFELELLREHQAAAIASPLLAEEHRDFLRELESDERGYPLYHGAHAGVGGVYHLRRG